MTEPRLAEETFFRPVRPGNAFEDTVQRLLQTIRLGVVAPGDSLPSERELAVRLGVSRDTVRDALRSQALRETLRLLHEDLGPQARAAGWLTEDDILAEVS